MIRSCFGSPLSASVQNRIIHQYVDIDPDIVWAIVQNDVPRLLEKSEALLEESGHGEI